MVREAAANTSTPAAPAATSRHQNGPDDHHVKPNKHHHHHHHSFSFFSKLTHRRASKSAALPTEASTTPSLPAADAAVVNNKPIPATSPEKHLSPGKSRRNLPVQLPHPVRKPTLVHQHSITDLPPSATQLFTEESDFYHARGRLKIEVAYKNLSKMKDSCRLADFYAQLYAMPFRKTLLAILVSYLVLAVLFMGLLLMSPCGLVRSNQAMVYPELYHDYKFSLRNLVSLPMRMFWKVSSRVFEMTIETIEWTQRGFTRANETTWYDPNVFPYEPIWNATWLDMFSVSLSVLVTGSNEGLSIEPSYHDPYIFWVWQAMSYVGLLLQVVMTGLFFTKFSRTPPRVQFSKFCIVTDSGITSHRALEFRVLNLRPFGHDVLNAQVEVVFSYSPRVIPRMRRSLTLKLVSPSVPQMPHMWTLSHVIDDESPLYGYDWDALEQEKGWLQVLMRGVDPVTSDVFFAKTQYDTGAFLFDACFENVVDENAEGTVCDIAKFHHVRVLRPVNHGHRLKHR
eukprot:m.192816 g.192816  ORF g.192816 m.192816 type:complete len:511 (+) comp25754_c0_seq2:131-1663(+)